MSKLVTNRWVSPNGEKVENTPENIERIKANLRINVEAALKMGTPALAIWNAIMETVEPYTGQHVANQIAHELLGIDSKLGLKTPPSVDRLVGDYQSAVSIISGGEK